METEFTSVYFNSTTKTVINSDKYMRDRSFQEILYQIDNWINEGTGSVIESISGEYMNIFIYSPNIELPNKLKNSVKGLINVKNNDNKCFFGVILDN